MADAFTRRFRLNHTGHRLVAEIQLVAGPQVLLFLGEVIVTFLAQCLDLSLGHGADCLSFGSFGLQLPAVELLPAGGNLAVNLHLDVVIRDFKSREGMRRRSGRRPMRRLHDNEPVAQRGSHHGQRGQQGHESFHARLDGDAGEMLPKNF